MEEKTLNLHQRILAVMADLKYIQKGSAKVNGQYSFVSHDQVTSAIHPHLVKHGLLIMPSVAEMKQEGNRTEVKLNVVFRNADKPDDALYTVWYGYGIDNADKGPGKAISYAYKYAILKTFCLETGDDPDNTISAAYEPAKCVEFDLSLPALEDKHLVKLTPFLEYSASVMGMHVEDVKREAVKRMPEFAERLKAWIPPASALSKKK